MTTIWERVENALTPFGIPFGVSDFKVDSGEDFPDTYMVYFVVDITPEQHADDEEQERSELVQITIYKRDSLVSLPDVIGAMISNGFTFAGGRQLEFDEDTGHYPIAFDFEYLENI